MTGALLIAKLPSYCPAKMSYQQALETEAPKGSWPDRRLGAADRSTIDSGDGLTGGVAGEGGHGGGQVRGQAARRVVVAEVSWVMWRLGEGSQAPSLGRGSQQT